MGQILFAGVFLGLLMLLGWWSGNQRADSIDAELRADLLRKTEQIAATINPDWVRKLAFTADDQKSPEYALISEQLKHPSGSFLTRGIYTLKKKGKKLYFGPESYPANDPMASLPGDEYQKPSPVCFSVFEQKKAATFGPVKDEFGAFITALVPLIDPESGEVLMVLGADILAQDWQARVNAARGGPIFRMLVVILALAVFGFAVVWRNRRSMIASMKLKAWVISPVLLAVLGGCVAYGFYEYQQIRVHAERTMMNTVENARETWQRNLAAQAQLLEGQMDHMLADPKLREAWDARDLGELTILAERALKDLKEEYGISHCYFIDADRRCFLRSHEPARRGDLIERFSLNMAVRSGDDAWSVEMGPLGTLTLRYVRPTREGSKITGYVELGIDSTKLFRPWMRGLGLEGVIALRKAMTTREKFQAGQKAFGVSGRWEIYRDFVVILQTIPGIPREIAGRLDGNAVSRDGDIFILNEGTRKILCGGMDLSDGEGRPVAHVFLLKDISSEVQAGRGKLFSDVSLLLVLMGGVLLLLWSVVDAAEQQLEESFRQVRESGEAYRRQFYDNLALMLLIDPEHGRIVDANEAAVRFYGYTREQFIGKPIAEINTLSPAEIELRLSQALRDGGGKFTFQHRLADGSFRDMDVSTSLIVVGGRRVLHSILYDVTARNRAEQELSESQRATLNILEDLTETNEKLKKLTEDLTRAKAELETQSWGLQKANDGIKALYQEMEKKNAKLEDLDRLKDDFVSIVAHELRNPLGVVREAAALLIDGLVGPVAEQQKTYVEMIRRTADRLIHITSDLLDLAKIESGKIVLRFEKIDFLSVVRQACDGIKLRTQKNGVEVRELFQGERLEIEADFDKILQVMINLLSNAVKFTEKGSITVEVADRGDNIFCMVKDTGPGISAENLGRLFSKFEQFGQPGASGEKGSGLGLVISKSIIDAHGGRIWAESVLGQGTSFLFELPKQQKRKQKLGEILVGEKVVTLEQLDQALKKQEKRGL